LARWLLLGCPQIRSCLRSFRIWRYSRAWYLPLRAARSRLCRPALRHFGARLPEIVEDSADEVGALRVLCQHFSSHLRHALLDRFHGTKRHEL
jgi:hypothetical protein